VPPRRAPQELVSNYGVAALLSKLLGRTITYRELTFEQFTADYAAAFS
jgi:hypothetical protein